MIVSYLVVLLLLVEITQLDSPLGQAVGDAIRDRVLRCVELSSPSLAAIDSLRREVAELRERLDTRVEGRLFLTQLMSRPRLLNPDWGEAEDADSPN